MLAFFWISIKIKIKVHFRLYFKISNLAVWRLHFGIKEWTGTKSVSLWRRANARNVTILYYTTIYYTILYYIILYYTILYYTILYYTVLYCTVLYCTVLYCTVNIQHYTIRYGSAPTFLYYRCLDWCSE